MVVVGTPQPIPTAKALATLTRAEVSELMAARQRFSAVTERSPDNQKWISYLADLKRPQLFAMYEADVISREEVRATLLMTLQWEKSPDVALGFVKSGWLTTDEVRNELRTRAGIDG